jgi:hypothetical protein
MGYTGRCACDAVQVVIEAEAVSVRQCWCRHCQHLAAGNATTNAFFPAEAVSTTGELVWNAHKADSGNELHWAFCPQCGSQMLAYSTARPQFRGVRVGAIDQPHDLAPQAIIWTSEAPAWAKLDPDLPHFAGQPPAAPPKTD